jgi:HAD superfamily hydrolase (TIGR01509 family)
MPSPRATTVPSTTAPVANPVHPEAMPQAVLWDMDGTIVDTEPHWIAAEKDLVQSHGGTWTDADARRLVGQALPTSARMLQDAGVPLGVREIIDTLSAKVAAAVAAGVPWRPGARELLAELAALGIPCALVTMSEAPLASAVAAALPEGTFRFLVTGDQVTHGKPHPDPYLTALDRMREWVPDLDPQRVVAIEDSVPGVASAAASGAATLAVPHFTPMPASAEWATWPTLEGTTAAGLSAVVRMKLASAASEYPAGPTA